MDTTHTGSAPKLTLGRKLLLIVLTFTGLLAANFIAYSHLLRELDRTAAAVDASGRQRMLSQKIAYMAFQVAAGHDKDRGTLEELAREFNETLQAFKHGGPSRNFFVFPAPEAIQPLVKAEEADWEPYMEAALLIAKAPPGSPALKKSLRQIEAHSEDLLSKCDAVTAAFRKTAEDAARRMQYLILLLIGLSLFFGAVVSFYAEKNLVAPLVTLDKAAAEITAGNFREIEIADSGDEVGNLSRAFSKMSQTIISRDMEKRLALNKLLAILLEHGSLPELLDKFLKSILSIPWLASTQKGAIFLADLEGKNLEMTAWRGIPAEIDSACRNLPAGRCLCGRAAAGETVFASTVDKRRESGYKGREPHGHCCIPIKLRGKAIGVLNLFVPVGHSYDESELDFLEAACAIIAKTIEYKNLEARSFQAQKMESLGRTAGAIAHDFNNILTVMQGFNELALETVPAGCEALRYVKETAAGLDRGAALVKQILAFSRNQPAEMASLDLNALIAGTRTMLGLVLEKKIRLKLSLAPGLPAIIGNKGQLEQILVNLAVNARDALLPAGGEFSITTSEAPAASTETCAKEISSCEKVVRLTVSDTGSGMPQEVIEHIFEPFFTTKPEGRGTGLGLATVYSLVQLHKGGITVKSRPGQGTTLEVRFPAAE